MSGILKNKQIFGDAFWVLSGQLASALALLAGTRILTELITPKIFGQVALLNGFVALGVGVFSYPYICAGMRILPECCNENQRADLFRHIYLLTFRTIAVAMLLLVLGGSFYSYCCNGNMALFVLSGILLAVTVWRELGVQLLIGGRRQRDASLWQTCDSILRPVFAIALVWMGGEKAEWVLLGYILASVVSNMLGNVIQGAEKLEKKHDAGIGRNFKKDVWVYALPLIPMELIYWINGLGDRYVIGYLMTAADVGLYVATYTIINEAINRSAMVLLRIFQPVYFQLFSASQFEKGFAILWIWLSSTLAMGVIGVSILHFTKDWLAALLLAKSYQAAVELMPAIAVGAMLHALGTVMAQPLLAQKRTNLLLMGRLCGAVTAAVSIPLMVKSFGLQGAALANPVYFGVEAMVLALLAKPWRAIGSGTQFLIENPASCKAGV